MPSAAKELEQNLASLEDHFEKLKAAALTSAQTVLGATFDPLDKQSRDNLEANIGPAQSQLRALDRLPSLRRARALEALTDLEWNSVAELIAQLRVEASAGRADPGHWHRGTGSGRQHDRRTGRQRSHYRSCRQSL
jgi:hypothetical protein